MQEWKSKDRVSYCQVLVKQTNSISDHEHRGQVKHKGSHGCAIKESDVFWRLDDILRLALKVDWKNNHSKVKSTYQLGINQHRAARTFLPAPSRSCNTSSNAARNSWPPTEVCINIINQPLQFPDKNEEKAIRFTHT